MGYYGCVFCVCASETSCRQLCHSAMPSLQPCLDVIHKELLQATGLAIFTWDWILDGWVGGSLFILVQYHWWGFLIAICCLQGVSPDLGYNAWHCNSVCQQRDCRVVERTFSHFSASLDPLQVSVCHKLCLLPPLHKHVLGSSGQLQLALLNVGKMMCAEASFVSIFISVLSSCVRMGGLCWGQWPKAVCQRSFGGEKGEPAEKLRAKQKEYLLFKRKLKSVKLSNM